ncbi:DUF1768-domain-containing protein [Mycena polygramma]|nr:DUF1768-domain-containing protein [Mycena polygramma]
MSYACTLSLPNTPVAGQLPNCNQCQLYPKRWDNESRTFHPYCSKSCAIQALGRANGNAHNAPQVANNCDHCHTYPKQWDNARQAFHAYCSRTCATQALGQGNVNQAVSMVSNNCVECGFRPKYGNHPYCGKTCAQAAMNATQSAPAPVSNNCIECGVNPKYGNHLYCGKTCAEAAKRPTSQPMSRSANTSNASSASNCDNCHLYPKGWDPKKHTFHPYCSRICANQALGRGNSNPSSAVSPSSSAPPPWSIGGASSAVGTMLWSRPNTVLSPSQRSSPQARQRILFYHRTDPHYGFTNFSPHPVRYGGKEYLTSEHLFQAFKFMDNRPDIAEKIRTISTAPRDAFTQARVHKAHQHPNWLKMNIAKMDVVVWHKFTQHEDLKQELLATGDAELVEDSAEDAFWGIGANGQGKNELGKALERLRTKLRAP